MNDLSVIHRNHSTSGIVGLKAGYELLIRLGRSDLALQQLLRTDYPSFGFEIQGDGNPEPATTIWELYDAHLEGPSMDSRNHVMYASPTVFLFHAVGGIRLAPGSGSGDGVWEVAPALVGESVELSWASTSVHTPHGVLSASWHLLQQGSGYDEWAVDLNTSVPVGATALVSLPLPPAESALGGLITPSDCNAYDSGHTGRVHLFRQGQWVFGLDQVDGMQRGRQLQDARGKHLLQFEAAQGEFQLHLRCRTSGH